MNILFLSHRVPYPPNKGEKIRTFHQVKYLKEQGHQVSVLAPFEDESELQHFTELERLWCKQVDGEKLAGKALRLAKGLLKNEAMSVANFYSSSLQAKFDADITQNQYDAVICTASSMAKYVFNSGTLDSLNPRPRIVMDFMDLDSDKWNQYANEHSFPMSWVYQREAKKVASYEIQTSNTFDTCLFITDTECELFRKNKPDADNVYAIENGMDTDTFKPAINKPQSESPIVLFTGVMDYAPNVDAVLWFVEHAWPQISQTWPEAKFYVAGMNPTEKVRALADKDSSIVVTGFVDDIMEYFDRSNIFVGPFNMARGVQNKILQAFACGIPVVATPMGAEGIRCKNEESILLANDGTEFVEQIKRLMNDQELYDRIASEALSVIQQGYSWDGILKPFERFLEATPGTK